MMSQTASRVAVMMAARCAALNQIAGLAVVMMDVQSAALNQPGARAAVMMAAQYEASNQTAARVAAMTARLAASRGVQTEELLDGFRSADVRRAEDYSSCVYRGAQHCCCCRYCCYRRLNFASAARAARPVDNQAAAWDSREFRRAALFARSLAA